MMTHSERWLFDHISDFSPAVSRRDLESCRHNVLHSTYGYRQNAPGGRTGSCVDQCGLSYLYGIDVEVDYQGRSGSQTGAANRGAFRAVPNLGYRRMPKGSEFPRTRPR